MTSFGPPMDTITQPEQLQGLSFEAENRSIDANGLKIDTEMPDRKRRGLNGTKIDQK